MGFATARLLASQGALVSIADSTVLDATSQSVPGERLITYLTDVRSIAEVRRWLEHTKKQFGMLDGAVNFAGVRTIERLKSTVNSRARSYRESH